MFYFTVNLPSGKSKQTRLNCRKKKFPNSKSSDGSLNSKQKHGRFAHRYEYVSLNHQRGRSACQQSSPFTVSGKIKGPVLTGNSSVSGSNLHPHLCCLQAGTLANRRAFSPSPRGCYHTVEPARHWTRDPSIPAPVYHKTCLWDLLDKTAFDKPLNNSCAPVTNQSCLSKAWEKLYSVQNNTFISNFLTETSF